MAAGKGEGSRWSFLWIILMFVGVIMLAKYLAKHPMMFTPKTTSSTNSAWQISDMGALYTAISHAKTVEATSYLFPTSLTNAIAGACRHGAKSAVTLAAPSYDQNISRGNADTVTTLRSAGCTAEQIQSPLHLKAVVIDANAAYLSDTNFSQAGFLLETTDPSAVGLLRNTIAGNTGRQGAFATNKGDALSLEAGMIGQGRGALCVSTESFDDSIIAQSLRAYHGSVHFIVAQSEASRSSSERAILQSMPQNVSVRLGSANEKMASDGRLAWLGSANATVGYPEQTDWGLDTIDPALVALARDRCERDFAEASPL